MRAAVLAAAAIAMVPALDAMAAETVEAPAGVARTDTHTGSYLSAHHAEVVGDYAAAANFLARVLESDADNPRLQRRAFIHLMSDGRIDEALPLAEKVEGGDQTAALATITRAIAAARSKEYAAAIELLATDLPGSFGQVIAPMLQAWLLQGAGKTEDGLASLETSNDNDASTLFRTFHIALINDVAGRSKDAETAFAKALSDSEGPYYRLLEAYVSFLARAGKHDEAEALLADVADENQQSMPVAAARSNLARGTRARPFVGSANDGLAEALFEIAAELRRENAPNVGLILAQLAVYVRPDFSIGHILIAEILDEQGQIEEAIASYDNVSDDSALDWQVRVRRAELMSEVGEVDQAIGVLEAMATERDDRPEPLIRMGHIMRADERFQDAVLAYDRAEARISELQPQHWRLLYARGIANERSKDWPRAEKDFLKALEFEPDQPYVLNYLGYSWVDQGMNLERAREMIERAVELRPRDGYIVDSLGWALYRMGEFDDAVDQLERAIELNPEDPVINDHLGDAYWRVGRNREARFQWNRALSFDPADDQVDIIRSKLDRGLQIDDEVEQDS